MKLNSLIRSRLEVQGSVISHWSIVIGSLSGLLYELNSLIRSRLEVQGSVISHWSIVIGKAAGWRYGLEL
jgi:hypothetical protein